MRSTTTPDVTIQSFNTCAPGFGIDIRTCRCCGGRLRVIAGIKEAALIKRILAHLGQGKDSARPAHPTRAPPASLPL